MQLGHLARAVVLWFCIGPGAVQAQAPCTDCAGTGRPFLGQGIALFDAKNFKQAERALQAALFVGLPQASEQVLAHKYLAFMYCQSGEQGRCDAAFDEVFALQPAFQLADYEARNASWRPAYLQARDRRAGRHPQPLAKGTPAARESPRTRDTYSDSNVRLRVAPWASVQVNGKQIGVTPPVTRLRLPVGSHAIRLSNPGFKPVRQVVKVVKGETVTVTHDFETR